LGREKSSAKTWVFGNARWRRAGRRLSRRSLGHQGEDEQQESELHSVIPFRDELRDDLFRELRALGGEVDKRRASNVARQGSLSRPRHARRKFQVNVLGAAYGT
jgi:hypothetical protein